MINVKIIFGKNIPMTWVDKLIKNTFHAKNVLLGSKHLNVKLSSKSHKVSYIQSKSAFKLGLFDQQYFGIYLGIYLKKERDVTRHSLILCIEIENVKK